MKHLKRFLRVLRFYFSKLILKDPLVKNMHHPQFNGMIEYAFTDKGKDYYTFKEQYDGHVPYGRYMHIMNFMQELELRISFEMLQEYVKKLKQKLEVKNGKLDIGVISMLVHQLESRMRLMFDAETAYRLASVIYFEAEEDLTKYDVKLCDAKITRWKENGTLDFFYSRPVKELLGLKSISSTDLQTYLTAMEKMDKETISLLQRL